MPKSVLDIDIHDEKFKHFLAAFKEFQVDAEKAGDVWKGFDVDTKKPRASIEALDKAINRAHGSSEKMAKAWKQIGGHIGESDKRLSRFERSIKTVERGLAKVASIGLKFGKFALAAGGIGIFGGLFGIDELANSAFNQQKSARGLNMPIGQERAWDVITQRILGSPNSVLKAIVNARQEIKGEAALSGLKFSPAQYKAAGLNKMKFGFEVLEHIKQVLKAAQENRTAPLAAIIQGRHLGALDLSLENARRIRDLPNGALHEMYRKAVSFAQVDQISNRTATAWSNLKVQLDQAGIAIRNDLIVHLVKLAPSIGVLSKKVEGFINEFLNAKDVGRFINTFAADIREAATYLGSKGFQQEVKSFASDVAMAGDAMLKFAKIALGITADVEKHKTLLKYGALGAAGLWLTGKAAKAWDFLKTPLTGAADDAGAAIGAGVGAAALAVGGLLYSPSLGNGDLPTPKSKALYKNAANWRKYNDPGNIDPVIDGHRFYRAFPSMAVGYRAMAAVLRGYHEDTVRSLVTSYEGKHAKHLGTHIDTISRWMHVKPDQAINLSNTNTLSHLVTDVAEFEQHHRMDRHQLYQTIRDAIIDGLRAGNGVRPGAQIANAMHAAHY